MGNVASVSRQRLPSVHPEDLTKDAIKLAKDFRRVADDVDNHCNNRGLFSTGLGVPLDLEDIFGDFFEDEQHLNVVYKQWEDFRGNVPKCFDLASLTDNEVRLQIRGLLSAVNFDRIDEDKLGEHVTEVQRYISSSPEIRQSSNVVFLPPELTVACFAFSFKDLVEMPVDMSNERSISPGTVLRNVASIMDNFAIMMPTSSPVKSRKPSSVSGLHGWV